MSALSVTMAADSTQGDIHEDSKKKKKHKTHKKYKKHKKRDSSSDTSVDSDLDLDKGMHPISHYVKDREVLVQQLFRSITTVKLRAMLPEVLKSFSIEELRSFCLEQLEVMSRKRILRILQGEDPENISSSSTEDESEEEKDKIQEKKEDNSQLSLEQATSEPATSASVSETEGTPESVAASGEEGELEEEEEEKEGEETEEVEEEEEETEEEVEVEEIEVEEEVTEEGVEIDEVEVEGDEEEGEEVEYEEIEIEVEETEEEEEGECESEEEVKEVKAVTGGEDTRKIEVKTEVPSKTSKPLQKKAATDAELQLHTKQDDLLDSAVEASSFDKTKKAKLSKAVKPLHVASSGVKAQPDTQQRRVKLNRDAMPAKTTEARTVKPLQSDEAAKIEQPQVRRTVKATKRKSSEIDSLSIEVGPSTSEGQHLETIEGPKEIGLSKNQMEILELEMRARAIKAMLKMHST